MKMFFDSFHGFVIFIEGVVADWRTLASLIVSENHFYGFVEVQQGTHQQFSTIFRIFLNSSPSC